MIKYCQGKFKLNDEELFEKYKEITEECVIKHLPIDARYIRCGFIKDVDEGMYYVIIADVSDATIEDFKNIEFELQKNYNNKKIIINKELIIEKHDCGLPKNRMFIKKEFASEFRKLTADKLIFEEDRLGFGYIGTLYGVPIYWTN